MKRPSTLVCGALALLVSAFGSTTAYAQPRPAKLLLTVVDQTGAVIPNAVVTATRADDPARTPIGPVKTIDTGLATLEGLAPGIYEIRAEFPGFEPRVMKEVRLRAGDNRQVAILAIQGVQDEITVGRDRQAAAADPKSTFGTTLTREQIEALSDDPDEMRRQIMDMAPEAVLRIDSFEGGQLPPKAQIKSIHITRDQYAAESHYAGAHFIDIITQPGMGPIRGGTNFRFRDRSLNATNPQTNFKGPEQSRNYGINFGGTLIKGKSSFALSINGGGFYDAPTIVSQGPEGRRIETLPIKRRRDNVYAYGNFDYALTKDQTLRMSFDTSSFSSDNQGIGQFDERERGYATSETGTTVRIQEAGPLGRRFFINTRLQLHYQRSDRESDVELPTIRIVDARTTGGAQQSGGRRGRGLNLMSDLDYVRGIHSLRTGIDINGSWYESNEDSNYLGTYTFESIDDFLAGRPRSYTRRIGDPNIKYHNVLGAVYLQDDIRVRKNLTLSPGIRYELQTHLDDFNSFAPRFGVNWAPFKSGKTTIRASWGIFYDWFSTGTYEQTLRVDGFRQQELNILDPTYPDPGDTGIVNATNRYLMGDDLGLVRTNRLSAGVSQTITPRIRVSATYANTRYHGLLRGENLNAPVSGLRPDPRFSNVIQIRDDAESRTNQLSSSMSISLATPGPAAQQARFNLRRGSVNMGYTLARQRSNSDGAFSIPFSGSPAGEWGPANNDIRHRLNVGLNSQALKNMNMFVSMTYTSATPYTIRTGTDDNGDLVFNDRPAGVGRNTERGEALMNVNANASYSIPFGTRKVDAPQGIMIRDGMVMAGAPGAAQSRYRISLGLSVQNLTNRVNHTGWNGTMTSPFFRQSTNVGAPRKIDMSVSFSF
ncbi:MAG TPA: TonB-dependent receptor [Vicinamibacterales bacterium]|nr:TonB-dependent receptor [Vicinamibacterales bacterium]